MTNIPRVTLNNSVEIPQLGFGVFLMPPDETKKAVLAALQAGYRHIDTAQLYGNEAEVGAALKESGLPRDDVFITTKVWNSEQGYDSTLRAFAESMNRLDLDRLDLLLIHWPVPSLDKYVDTWKAFERLYADGLVRAIGVSNFHQPHLQRLFDETSVVPTINQIELHPHLQQAAMRAFNAEHGIATEAWSPLGRGTLIDDRLINEIAARHNKTPAQILLRWHIELGNVVIPKSKTPSRIVENTDIFDFSLTADDMAGIATLDNGTRVGPNPDPMS